MTTNQACIWLSFIKSWIRLHVSKINYLAPGRKYTHYAKELIAWSLNQIDIDCDISRDIYMIWLYNEIYLLLIELNDLYEQKTAAFKG